MSVSGGLVASIYDVQMQFNRLIIVFIKVKKAFSSLISEFK